MVKQYCKFNKNFDVIEYIETDSFNNVKYKEEIEYYSEPYEKTPFSMWRYTGDLSTSTLYDITGMIKEIRIYTKGILFSKQTFKDDGLSHTQLFMQTKEEYHLIKSIVW